MLPETNISEPEAEQFGPSGSVAARLIQPRAPVYLDQEPERPTVNIDSSVDSVQRPMLDPELAANRAYKFNLSMPQLNMSQSAMQEYLQNGQERELRNIAAMKVDADNQTKAADLVRKLPTIPIEKDVFNSTLANLTTPTDPNSVFEQQYGIKFADTMRRWSANNSDSSVAKAFSEMPNTTNQLLNSASELVSRREYLQTKIEDLYQEVQNQGWPSYMMDALKSMLPVAGSIYNEVKMRNRIPGSPSTVGLGENIEKQAEYLFGQPFPQFKQLVDQSLDSFKKDNPSLAMEWATALLGQSKTEKLARNFWLPVDLITLGAAAKSPALLEKFGAISEANEAIKRAVAEQSKLGNPSAKGLAEAVGDNRTAAQVDVANGMVQKINGEWDPTKRSIEALPGIFKTDLAPFGTVTKSTSQDLVNRMNDAVASDAGRVAETLNRAIKVDQMPASTASTLITQEIIDSTINTFPGLSNNVMYYGDHILYDEIGKSWYAVMGFGKETGENWSSWAYARGWAKKQGLGENSQVVSNGNGWAVETLVPINPRSHPILDSIVGIKTEPPGKSFLNQWFNGLWSGVGKGRTSEEVLSFFDKENRKAMTFGISNIQQLYEHPAEDLKVMKSWGKDKRENFVRALKGNAGNTFDTTADLDHYYLTNTGKLPDEQEVMAYFGYKRIQEITKYLRTVSDYSARANEGNFSMRVSNQGPTGRNWSREFDGKETGEWPREGNVLIVNQRQGDEVLLSAGPDFAGKEELKAAIKEGKMKVVQVYDDHLRPFQGFSEKVGTERVTHVVTENLETKPLNWNSAAARARDFAIEPRYPWKMQQSIVKNEKIGDTEVNRYEGARTVGVAYYEKLMREQANHWNEVRRLIGANKVGDAKRYVESHDMGMEWKDVYSQFRWSKDADGRDIPAKINTREPILVSRDGEDHFRLAEAEMKARHGNTFVDGTAEGPAMKAQLKWNNSRDVYEVFQVNDKGTLHNPIISTEPASYIDPLTMMNRGLNMMSKMYFMDDYKAFAKTYFLESLSRNGMVTPEFAATARRSPDYAFERALDSFLPGAEKGMVNRFTAQHYHINKLLKAPSELDSSLHSAAQKLYDATYEKFGGKVAEYAPFWMLPAITNFPQFLRSAVFHPTIGLYNPVQFFVQMNGFTNVFGVAGFKYAAPGTKAMFLEQMYRKNPEMLDHLDDLATKQILPGTARWKPGEFKEFVNLLHDSGFQNVGREYAMRDDMYNYKVINHPLGTFLDAGTIFFKEGDRTVRTGALATAYLEHRAKFPTGRLTPGDERAILDRAALLWGNMSRDSNSALTTGIMSVPTQFATYYIRLLEEMTGGRLSTLEKSRLFAWYSALYGLPVGTLVTAPFADMIRQKAMENGYVPSDKWYVDVLMNGLPATMVAVATGRQYNFGDRMGPGFDAIMETLRGDKSFLSVVAGASGSVWANAVSSLSPAYHFINSMIKGEVYTPTFADAMGIMKNASLVNSAVRNYLILKTGQWFSRKENQLANDVDWKDAAANFFLGLTPMRINDENILSAMGKSRDEGEKWAMDEYSRNWQRGVRALEDMNQQAADTFFRNASTILNLYIPINGRDRALERALRNSTPLLDKLRWDILYKHPPKGSEELFNRMYEKYQQLEGNK